MNKEPMQVMISGDLKRRFKAACVLEDRNMSEVVEMLIVSWLNARKPSESRETAKTTSSRRGKGRAKAQNSQE